MTFLPGSFDVAISFEKKCQKRVLSRKHDLTWVMNSKLCRPSVHKLISALGSLVYMETSQKKKEKKERNWISNCLVLGLYKWSFTVNNPSYSVTLELHYKCQRPPQRYKSLLKGAVRSIHELTCVCKLKIKFTHASNLEMEDEKNKNSNVKRDTKKKKKKIGLLLNISHKKSLFK